MLPVAVPSRVSGLTQAKRSSWPQALPPLHLPRLSYASVRGTMHPWPASRVATSGHCPLARLRVGRSVRGTRGHGLSSYAATLRHTDQRTVGLQSCFRSLHHRLNQRESALRAAVATSAIGVSRVPTQKMVNDDTVELFAHLEILQMMKNYVICPYFLFLHLSLNSITDYSARCKLGISGSRRH